VADQLHGICQQCAPDVLLLGGDLADMKNGLPLLGELVAAQSARVLAVPGNHDDLVGLSAVRACVERAGGQWLAGVDWLCDGFAISGSCDERAEGNAVLCAHDPQVFPQAISAGYRLVLAGHLHGGQWVAAQRNGKLYPAAWFYPWAGDCFAEGQTTMLVSR